MGNFGDAVPKREGAPFVFDIADMNVRFPTSPDVEPEGIETEYVERRVPSELVGEAHKLLDSWLRDKGFDPEEI